jgi:hypothetical protein
MREAMERGPVEIEVSTAGQSSGSARHCASAPRERKQVSLPSPGVELMQVPGGPSIRYPQSRADVQESAPCKTAYGIALSSLMRLS